MKTLRVLALLVLLVACGAIPVAGQRLIVDGHRRVLTGQATMFDKAWANLVAQANQQIMMRNAIIEGMGKRIRDLDRALEMAIDRRQAMN
jgi:hypothetical protein